MKSVSALKKALLARDIFPALKMPGTLGWDDAFRCGQF